MLKIRLRRPGKSIKGRTHQKIVVTEKNWARESRFIDQVGYYDPKRDLLKIDTDKYKEWLQKGAQPSETVASLFKNYGKPKKKKVSKSEQNQQQEKNEKLETGKKEERSEKPVEQEKPKKPEEAKNPPESSKPSKEQEEPKEGPKEEPKEEDKSK